MLKQLRQNIIHHLWQQYRGNTTHMQAIESKLREHGVTDTTLDHFAVIDLPGPNTGISHLSQMFSAIGYLPQGRDYLPEKQNEFLWMTEIDSYSSIAKDVLPQVVVADFWLQEMPPSIQKIIEKYASQAAPAPIRDIHQLMGRVYSGDENAAMRVSLLFNQYFTGRDWPLPTVNEFHTVKEFNELLAWVLVFGRKPNHFTLSVHLLSHFKNLDEFHHFIEHQVNLQLNDEGGTMKGGQAAGIAQGSTKGIIQTVELEDGAVELPTGFVEFVWRFANNSSSIQPLLWKDYFPGFIAHHANHVIESLYTVT